jgi:osomolarity two-component system response regulator SKN7
MDIIMPNLDGVSATAMIRMVAPQVPIVAMTSNIRQEDIQTYFQFGKFPLPPSLTSF